MKRTLGGPLVLAATAALAAGCGDDDKALSKPEYVKQANAICKKFNGKIERQVEKELSGVQSERDLTPGKARGFFKAALPEYRQAVDDLKALDPPEDDKDTVEMIYAVADREGDKIEASLDDDAKVKALLTSSNVTPRFQKLSKEYGLDTCAED